MHVDGQPLAGVEQLDEQLRVGASAGGVVGAEEAQRVRRQGIASSRPSGRRLSPSSRSPKTVVVEPTHSSGTRSPALSTPRSAAIASPPR